MKKMSDGATAKAMTMLQQLQGFVRKNGGDFEGFLKEQLGEGVGDLVEEQEPVEPEAEGLEGDDETEVEAAAPAGGDEDKAAKVAAAISVMKRKMAV